METEFVRLQVRSNIQVGKFSFDDDDIVLI